MGTREIFYYAILLRDGYGVSGEEWGVRRGDGDGDGRMGMEGWVFMKEERRRD